MSTPVQYLKGVGPRRAELLRRLGVETVGDALRFFPRRYDDRRAIRGPGTVRVGEVQSVAGEIRSLKIIRTRRRGARLAEVVLADESGSLTGLWFNFREPLMRKRFVPGRRFVFHGEVKWDGTRAVVYHPEAEELGGGPDDSIHFGRIVPVYHLTEDMGQRQMRKIMHEAVRAYAGREEDALPAYLREKYHLPGLRESLAHVHFPPADADPEELNRRNSRWHKRLVFEEFFFLELAVLASRAERLRTKRSRPLSYDPGLMERFVAGLPFRLTGGQALAFEDIRRDMLSPHPMHRLLQGDVGCGKTVVLAMAVLLAADNGLQAALMAPTEILARQHQRTLEKLFAGLPLSAVLLVNGLPAAERKAALEMIASGEASLAVGTHAIIQEGVVFRELGLVVVDEQHRFGVSHRVTLRLKGRDPDTLTVSATPIPRSLAMTLYGDMDLTVIEDMPPGRQPPETRVVEEDGRGTVWDLVRGELEAGRRAYVIYPLIDESARLELRAAQKMAAQLAADVFPGFGVGLLHGRMGAGEKDAVMGDFQAGRVRLLVSTTVVEVGVDVPEASVMVVEHAERFGLAQLHQLRGRVGRGGQKSWCFLVVSGGAGDEARTRLEVMTRTADGFLLAEEDLKSRGPGELTGLRQSGAPDFLLASIIRHRKALEYAREEALAALEGRAAGKIDLTKMLSLADNKWSRRSDYLASG